MNQFTFPLLLYVTLAFAVIAYLLRRVTPRIAHIVGWSSAAAAALTFIAMVVVDAFQPELPALFQDLAMPAPAERTGAYWAALWFHVILGLVSAIYSLYILFASRPGFAHAAR